jgi:hypothetical protein
MTVWFETEEVIAPLDAFETLPDWLRAGMDGERIKRSLEQVVPELASEQCHLRSCTPQRLRAKEDQWLARYLLDVAASGGQATNIVLVGNLYAPAVPEPTFPDPGPTSAFGTAGWSCWLPDLRLLLRVEEADPALPALQDIVDPAAAADLLQKVLIDAGYGSAVVASCRPDVVRYKPGSRCTVVVGVTYANSDGLQPGPDPIVIKTHQGDKGQTAWAAMTALWESPLRDQGVVTIAEPLAYDADRRLLFQGPIREDQTLKVLAREAITDGSPAALQLLREELAKTGRALAALHQCGASYGRTATLDEEVLEIREVVGRLSFSVPELQAAAAPLLSRLNELSADFPAEQSVPAHHDFRPAQVLLHAGDVGFIDFDGASMAEPALDLGRFRAKLRDIGISVLAASGRPLTRPSLDEHLTLLDELCDAFLDAYREQAPVSRERVLLWETCDLMTGMLHAWTKVRLARIGPRLTVLRHHLSAISDQSHQD